MLYSWNMIGRLINIDDSYENLAKNLTLKSCEVEEVKKRQLPDELVVWKTTKVEKHPDADKLYVCQVDCGEYWKFQIITWWENIVSNRFVAVALPGCYLSHIDLKIWERKMRWLDSAGMICSKEELWINEDTDKHWIWLLDEDILVEQSDIWKPLKNVATYLENAIIDVENKESTEQKESKSTKTTKTNKSTKNKKIENETTDSSEKTKVDDSESNEVKEESEENNQ